MKMPGFMKAQLHLNFFFSVLVDGVVQEAIFPCLCWTKLIKFCWTNLHNSRTIGQSPVTARNWLFFLEQCKSLPWNQPNGRCFSKQLILITEIRWINKGGIIETMYFTMAIFYKSKHEARSKSFNLLTSDVLLHPLCPKI